MVSHYQKGAREGPLEEYYPPEASKQQIKLKASFKDGKREGSHHEYYANGQKQLFFQYQDGALHGHKKIWSSEGVLLEGSNYKEGVLDGEFFRKNADGSEEVCNYKDNKKEGKYLVYYPYKEGEEKILAIEAQYKNDLLDGETKEYHISKKLVGRTHYASGKKKGMQKSMI